MVRIRRYTLEQNGVDDQETITLLGDLISVQESLHQDGPVAGPWMEARLKEMLREWLPANWHVSGPSQIYCRNTYSIRSCSWDIVVHRKPQEVLPPPASFEFGYPLLPKDFVAAVIDTKTFFADVSKYAKQAAFNLMNDYAVPQITFLGRNIRPFIVAATSSVRPDDFYRASLSLGLGGFALASRRADSVSAGEDRRTTYTAQRYSDGTIPLQRFKAELLAQVGQFAAAT